MPRTETKFKTKNLPLDPTPLREPEMDARPFSHLRPAHWANTLQP